MTDIRGKVFLGRESARKHISRERQQEAPQIRMAPEGRKYMSGRDSNGTHKLVGGWGGLRWRNRPEQSRVELETNIREKIAALAAEAIKTLLS